MTEPEPEPELEQDLTFTIRSPLNEPAYNGWNIILIILQWLEYNIGATTMGQNLALELELRDLDLL